MLQFAILLLTVSADPDKALGPDGKPWTAQTMVAYVRKSHKDGEGNADLADTFTLAMKLSLEISVGKRKQAFVVSETPDRSKFLAAIEKEFKIDEPPSRAILVFSGRDKFFARLKPDSEYAVYLRQPPTKNATNKKAQSLYWADAAEILDFHGDEDAAKAYADGFLKVAGNERLGCRRWYSITCTGARGAVRKVFAGLEGYPGYRKK